jgi:hypothetical protein
MSKEERQAALNEVKVLEMLQVDNRIRLQCMGVWEGVAMDSPMIYPGPPCPTLLRPVSGLPLKRHYGHHAIHPSTHPLSELDIPDSSRNLYLHNYAYTQYGEFFGDLVTFVQTAYFHLVNAVTWVAVCS